MRALGFISTFDELAAADRRLGRKVANYGMVAALLEHSSYDELHFFLPFAGALKPFERGYAPWLQRPGVKQRVKLWHAAGTASVLERNRLSVMHAGELDRYFPELCHLRNRMPHPFAVTCTTHTLSYWSTQVRNLYKLMPGPRPYDAVLCTSRAAKLHLEQYFAQAALRLQGLGLGSAGFAGQLKVAPLGVDAKALAAPDQARARQELGLPPRGLGILCLGRLNPGDKYDLMPLLGILALLSKEMDFCLILAGAAEAGYGDKVLSAAAQMGLEGRVHLFADFDSAQKTALYGAADVLVSPADNLQETFGLTILEAMAAGLPVIASDFSGYRDLVIPGETGWLVPTLGPSGYAPLDAVHPLLGERIAALQISQRTALDLGAVAAALKALAADPELGPRLGRAGQKRVLAEFDWPVVIQKMEAIWDQLAAEAVRVDANQPDSDVLGAGLGPSFGHFVTRALAPGDHLAPGPLAGPFKAGIWGQSPHPDLAGALPPQAVAELLGLVEKNNGRASLADLIQGLAGKLPAHQVEHLALFALKYGILSLAR